MKRERIPWTAVLVMLASGRLTDAQKILVVRMHGLQPKDGTGLTASASYLGGYLGWSTRKVERQRASLVQLGVLYVKRGQREAWWWLQLPEFVPVPESATGDDFDRARVALDVALERAEREGLRTDNPGGSYQPARTAKSVGSYRRSRTDTSGGSQINQVCDPEPTDLVFRTDNPDAQNRQIGSLRTDKSGSAIDRRVEGTGGYDGWISPPPVPGRVDVKKTQNNKRQDSPADVRALTDGAPEHIRALVDRWESFGPSGDADATEAGS